MKKYLALLLALAMSFTLLAGCGSETNDNSQNTNSGTSNVSDNGNGGTTSSGKNELTIGVSSDIGSMYPFGSAVSSVKAKRLLAYEMLFWQDEDRNLIPSIGKSVESKGNGVYEVEIFDYITDSEGNHLTAEDVIFSLELYMASGSNAATYATLSDYRATGDYTVQFTFEPESIGQYKVLLSNLYCISKAAWENSPDEMATYPVGTGGYTLNTAESVQGATYVFEKRDDYWQTDEAYINDYNSHNFDKVTVRVITDTSTMAIALQKGEIDYSGDISANDMHLFTDENGDALEGYSKISGVNNSFTHLIFNCGPNSPCSDINVRRAICYAIDAAACCYNAYGVFGEVCNTATNPNLGDSGLEFGHDNYFPYDVDYAKQLLEQSSYQGETIQMLVQPVAVVSSSAPLIQAYCAAIGINIELLEYDMAQYRAITGDESGLQYDIELYGSAGGSDDYVFRSIMELDTKNYSNGETMLHIEDAKLQELYDDVASVERNSPEAVQAYLDYLEENCYVYGLYYSDYTYIARSDLTNLRATIYLGTLFTGFERN